MGKFVNPKKIKGQDKLNRIKDLMGKMNTLSESTSHSELELVKKGPNGVVYGIIRENRNYFIKTSTKTTGELNSNDFDYVGGLQNKGTEKYNSYAEALKHLNMKFDMLNESFGVENNVNLFETDGNAIAGGAGFGFVLPEMEGKDEEIIADQKKVLNVDVPKSEEPVEDEVDVEMDVKEDPFGDEESVEMDAEVEEEGDDEGDGYTKKIQKLTGKIGQMLRDKDEPDAELDKYVINSIISAINWEEIPDDDVEDIIAKIEGEDEEDDALEGGDEVEMDTEVEMEEDPFAEEGDEEEIAESEEKVEEKETVNISEKEMKDLDKKGYCICDDKCLIDSTTENAADVLEKVSKLKKECLVLSEKQMKMLKEEGECSCGGVKLKCEDKKEKVEETEEKVDEGNEFSGARADAIANGKKTFKVGDEEYPVIGKKEEKNESKKFTKKQLMENFLNKTINESLNKIINEELLCEECGKIHEGPCSSHIDEYSQTDMLAGDDVNEQDMDIVDAIATGQNYLQASGDLDRDGDGIPNRLDMDSNMDGDLDHPTFGDDFEEIDIDALLGNAPAPTKEPGIAEPTTRPGKKKPRWKKIPRPNVNPKPKALAERKKPTIKRNGMYK